VGALLALWVLRLNTSPAFTPARAELANARGFSRGLVNLVVLPRDLSFVSAPGWASVAVVAGFLVLAWIRPPVGLAATAVPVLGATLFALVALSGSLTPYRLVLAPRTFVLGVLLLWTPRLSRIVSSIRARPWITREATVGRLAIFGCGALGAAFYGSAMHQTLATFDGNYSGFVHVSRDVAAHAPFLQDRPELIRSLILYDVGYDGEFFYMMAFDPFLQRFKDHPQRYRAYIDAPPYRYSRIGFSLLTDFASGFDARRFSAAMMWLILACHLALATSLASIAARHGVSPLSSLGYVAIPGFMASLLFGLPEALAAAGLVAGFLAWERGRTLLPGVCFAAALLIRETGIIFIAALLLMTARHDWRRRTAVAALAILPLVGWRAFVGLRLFADFGWQAVMFNPGDLGVPFEGLAHMWHSAILRTQSAPEIAGAAVYPLLLTLSLALAVCLLWVRRGPLELAAVLYGVIAVSLNYDKIWHHLPSGERGTVELFLCLFLILLTNGTRSTWIDRALTVLFILLAAYSFAVGPEAATSRAALLLIR